MLILFALARQLRQDGQQRRLVLILSALARQLRKDGKQRRLMLILSALASISPARPPARSRTYCRGENGCGVDARRETRPRNCSRRCSFSLKSSFWSFSDLSSSSRVCFRFMSLSTLCSRLESRMAPPCALIAAARIISFLWGELRRLGAGALVEEL